MTIQVEWDTPEKKLIHLQFERGWTWDELKASIQRADDLITSVSHTVHLIIDISHAGGLPKDFMSAAGDLFAQGEARANEGQKIIVGAGFIIRTAYAGFQAVYGHHLEGRPFLFAKNMDEARTMLNTVEQTNPELKP